MTVDLKDWDEDLSPETPWERCALIDKVLILTQTIPSSALVLQRNYYLGFAAQGKKALSGIALKKHSIG